MTYFINKSMFIYPVTKLFIPLCWSLKLKKVYNGIRWRRERAVGSLFIYFIDRGMFQIKRLNWCAMVWNLFLGRYRHTLMTCSQSATAINFSRFSAFHHQPGRNAHLLHYMQIECILSMRRDQAKKVKRKSRFVSSDTQLRVN